MRYRIFYYIFNSFFQKKLYFLKKRQKTVLGLEFLLRGTGRFATKTSVTFFFIGDEVSNIFSSKNEYNLFYRKLDAKYFRVT